MGKELQHTSERNLERQSANEMEGHVRGGNSIILVNHFIHFMHVFPPDYYTNTSPHFYHFKLLTDAPSFTRRLALPKHKSCRPIVAPSRKRLGLTVFKCTNRAANLYHQCPHRISKVAEKHIPKRLLLCSLLDPTHSKLFRMHVRPHAQ